MTRSGSIGWTNAHTRYVLAEVAAGAMLTVALSCTFAMAVFGWRLPVATASSDFQADGLLQSFIVAFMSAFVPALTARRRLARGAIALLHPRRRRRSPARRALVIALVLAPVATSAHLALTRQLLAPTLDLGGLLIWKSLFGVAVATASTIVAVALALQEVVSAWS